MMVVPQGMAYASVAGLPVVYGLYTAFVPVMIHPWFTTSNEITVGPTAIVSVRATALLLEFAYLVTSKQVTVPQMIVD